MSEGNRITIAISAFREGPWLRECWESVERQSDQRWRALLVLDGDADEATREVFDAISHPRLTKHALPENLGHGGSRNRAFELTETPYHFYVDGDDLLPAQSVAWMNEGIDAHPHAAMLYGDIEWFGDYNFVNVYPRQMSWDALARLDALQGSGAVYRVDAWRRVGGLAREMWASGSDFDFNIALAEAGQTLVHVGHTVYRYRKYRASNSERNAHRCWQKHETMVARHPAFFADAARRRDFLRTGYEYSFRTLYELGRLPEAKAVARRALAAGAAQREFWPMWFLARLPLGAFRALVPLWRLRRGLRRRARPAQATGGA